MQTFPQHKLSILYKFISMQVNYFSKHLCNQLNKIVSLQIFNFQLKQQKLTYMLGLIEHQRRSLNSAVKFLHLGLQIVAAYWAVVIDGYSCQEAFVKNVTYFAYAMIVFNGILIAFFSKFCTNQSKAFAYYAPLLLNLGLVAGILYFTIQGYKNSNACAPTRVLYEFFFIECVIAIVLFIMLLVANISWADRYSHWPGNLAWPILFLKVGFSGGFRTPAIVIGAIHAFISITSLIINAINYRTGDDIKQHKMLYNHQLLCFVLMIVTEVLAIAMLVINGKDGEYWYEYSRKVFVIFAAVNLVDLIFYLYGYRRMSAWSLHTQKIL